MKAKTFATVAVAALALATPALAASEGMPGMPKLEAKATYTIESAAQGEALQDQRGFGDQEKRVAMMNLMMVEGSGYEGMEMGAMAPATQMAAMDMGASQPAVASAPLYEVALVNPAKTNKVGANMVVFTVQQHHKPAKGLKLKAQVYMTSMDMGTDEPKVKEIAPGKYQLKAVFSMGGPWAVKLLLPDGTQKISAFSATK